ncbi:TauD/TfdA dioxygenase family protein [Micromonospora endophytica]|uniref:Uncharacterized protein n=1 Tax=Micromonospora endophytica TaxID=515350 RepID=A0A2W2CBC5_9ACTN|nr:TauD/TfdA family dioxygenase [Micromonospora endophytica]PZF95832.1 hypothetical protein C1I93_14750 [Micromonospora endophytica]BCJ61426.1 hypothetical protein Jiend_48480 [Micromonospora endophytica]
MSLTPSGLGTRFGADVADDLVDTCQRAATRTGLALVRGLDLDADSFQRLVHALGDTVDHKFGEGRADLLELNASADDGKVVTGRGPLPLHTDGLLVGERTDLIVLYAARFSDRPGSGETTVCDQLAAWAEMPDDLRQVIEHTGLEYLVEERGYFPTVPQSWYEIPAVRDYGRVRSLNLTLPFPPGVPRGWQVRVKGADEEDSARFFARLGEFLHRPRYLYQHSWQVGDLMVIDNQRTLHGRTAISDDGERLLFRGQVTLAADRAAR